MLAGLLKILIIGIVSVHFIVVNTVKHAEVNMNHQCTIRKI